MKTLPADAENLKKSRESQVESLRTFNPENLRVGYVGENTIVDSVAADEPGTLFVASIFDEVTLRRIGRTYGKTMQEARANAAFIVRACNDRSADKAKIKALVEASSRIIGLIESGYLIPATDGNGRTDHAVSNLRAALATA